MDPNNHEEGGSEKFLLGLVEGFYGRPFTADQRKELFIKLKKYGHQLYVYAPKDDFKHRAAWRELYTVEEGEHLQGLISAAKATGIDFYYALSPGLDITYSSIKDVSALKRKLDQVSHFGCGKFICALNVFFSFHSESFFRTLRIVIRRYRVRDDKI